MPRDVTRQAIADEAGISKEQAKTAGFDVRRK
jgi:hypothetical protein